jgi:hypothetical protein
MEIRNNIKNRNNQTFGFKIPPKETDVYLRGLRDWAKKEGRTGELSDLFKRINNVFPEEVVRFCCAAIDNSARGTSIAMPKITKGEKTFVDVGGFFEIFKQLANPKSEHAKYLFGKQ